MIYSTRPFGSSDIEKIFQDMKIKPSLLLFSFIGALGLVLFANRVNVFAGDPDPKKEAALMQAILQGVKSLHFQPKPVDNTFSVQVFDLYLKDIDGGKRFLTQRDVDMLLPFREQLDDQALAGTFQCFDVSVTLLEQSLTKTQGWYREMLAAPLDFTKNETLEADGKKLDWAKSDDELRARWTRWMKYEVLSRVTEEQDKQEKPDFKGEKKDFATLEADQRKKVLDTYDKWYKRMQKLDRTKRLETYLNAVTNVFDPHTGYFSPKEKQNFDIQMSGKLEGIGARLQSDGEKTSVSEIVPGGPAWKQGILEPKDVILKVAQGSTDAESIDIMGWDIDDVVAKVRGPKGTRVTLTIQKPDGAEKVITITRDVVLMEEGFAKSLILRQGEGADKVGFIYLPKFYADFTPQGMTSCAADVAKEVEKLKQENVQGIILDLRGNGGGSLRDVVQMSGLFVEDGPMVQVKNRSRKPDVMEDNDNNSVAWSGPFIVMVNGFSASASEILAAAMQDYKRAVIVGSTSSYGKGTVQRFIDLDNATGDDAVKPLGEMKLTIQKFYRVTGKTTQLDGVKPDIVLPDFYNLVDLGERENDHPLESTTIEPVYFNQNAYRIADLGQLKKNSETRVKADATFQKIEENAKRLKRQKDQSQYPLQAAKYREWNKKQDEEAAQYENMFKPIEGFTVENLTADMTQIQADTARMARNTDWLKDKKKDIQLFETFNIMQDMIKMDAVAAGGEKPQATRKN
jgi:carboxyl-terminal processing protease